MSERDITGATLAALMKPGQGYEARQLAEKLGVSTVSLRVVLSAAVQNGAIEQTGARRNIRYWLPRPRAAAFVVKPYKPPTEMQQAMERCKELRLYPSKF